MKYKNLVEKYNIHPKQIKDVLLKLTRELSKMQIDTSVHLAIIELFTEGDIKNED